MAAAQGGDARETLLQPESENEEDGLASHLTEFQLHSRADVRRNSGLSAVLEPFTLFFRYPGFFKINVLIFFLFAGATMPGLYVLPELRQKIDGTHAAANTQAVAASGALLSIIFAPFFGRWSDRHGRRPANLILCLANNCPPLVLLVFGQTREGLMIYRTLSVLLKPLSMGPSGSPVCWAYLTDQLPPEHRLMGFTMTCAVVSVANILIPIAAIAIADLFLINEQQRPTFFLWITFGNVLIFCLGLVWMGPDKPREAVKGATGPAKQGSVCSSLLSPFRMLARSATFRVACLIAALISLPDVAATGVANPILFQLLNITGDNAPAQQSATLYFSTLSQIPNFFAFIAVGMVGERVGVPKLVKCWLPVVCVLFAAPMLLLFWTSGAAVMLSGSCVALAATCFAPIQALVALVVHPDQIGEALGTLGAMKNAMSFIAPLAMASITEQLAEAGRNDLLWVIFPVSAAVMLCAWPFTFCLEPSKTRKVVPSH